MKRITPYILLFFAVVIALFSFVGDDSWSHLVSLRKQLAAQKQQNIELEEAVHELKGDVSGLQNNPRVLEKAARNELGLARDNEIVFIFDK